MKKNLLKLTVLATSVILAMSALTGCSSDKSGNEIETTTEEIEMTDDNGVEIQLDQDFTDEFEFEDSLNDEVELQLDQDFTDEFEFENSLDEE